MSVSVVSYSSSGGAGTVSGALVHGFRKIGVDAQLHVATHRNLREAPLEFPSTTMRAAADNYLLKKSSWESLVSYTRDKTSLLSDEFWGKDLTIFRWMNGLLGRQLFRDSPRQGNLVWGLDDMNPFTGVCHYSGNCRGHEFGCQDCPAVRGIFKSTPVQSLRHKISLANALDARYVAPTDWILEQFNASELGRGRVADKILNPLPDRFFSGPPRLTKSHGDLKLLLVAANLDDATKGVWSIADELSKISNQQNVSLTLVGRASGKLRLKLSNSLFLGTIPNTDVSEIIQGQDALIVPSLSENAGTVVAEAASQGVPSIARAVGGMPEMTNYGESGFTFTDETELTDILNRVNHRDLARKGKMAIEWAQQLRPERIASKYAEKYL